MSAPPLPIVSEAPLSVRIANNAEQAVKSGSTWVVGVVGALALLYIGLGDTQKEVLIAALPPFLKGWGLVLTPLAAYLVARLKPSDAISAQTKALRDEVIRLQLNEYLRAHGAPEVPAPAGAPVVVPVPAVVIPPPPDPQVTAITPPAAAEPRAAPPAPMPGMPFPAPAAVVEEMMASVRAGPPATVADMTRDGTWELDGRTFTGPELRRMVARLMPMGTPSSAIDIVMRKYLADLPT